MDTGVAGQEGKVGVLGKPSGLRDTSAVLLVGIHDQVPEQEVHELHGHDVEHDRGEDLVDAAVGLQRTRYCSPDGATEQATEQHQRHEEHPRQVRYGEGHQRRDDRPRDHLALPTDVDDRCPEGDADAHAHQQEGYGLDRSVSQGVEVTEGAVKECPVAPDRVHPEHEEHDPTHQEGCHDRADGHEKARQPRTCHPSESRSQPFAHRSDSLAPHRDCVNSLLNRLDAGTGATTTIGDRADQPRRPRPC